MIHTFSTPTGSKEDQHPQSPSWLFSVCLENGTCWSRNNFLDISSRRPLWFAKLITVRHEFTAVMVRFVKEMREHSLIQSTIEAFSEAFLFLLKIPKRSIERTRLMWKLHLAIVSDWSLRNWTGMRPWRNAAVMVAILLAFTMKPPTAIWHWLLNEMDFLSGLVFPD